MEASARLMKVGATSPSCPAASSAAASHSERTVPTSCAKHSVQDLSGYGRPSFPGAIREEYAGRIMSLTCIEVVEFQEVAFLVQLIRMAVEEGEDGQKFGYRVLCVHQRRLICSDHRHWARRCPLPARFLRRRRFTTQRSSGYLRTGDVVDGFLVRGSRS